MKDKGFFKKCCHSLAKEFERENFKLNHIPVDDFYTSQWQTGSKNLLFLIYRWLIALFFVGVVFTCMAYTWTGGKFFIFLTDWGFIMCMITTVFGAVLVTRNYVKPFDSEKQTLSFKLYWALHITTLIIAIVITVVYWVFLYEIDADAKKDARAVAFNTFQHACNTGVMLFDQLIIAFPTKLLHFIYPLTFATIYGVFTIIYYETGGTDPYGKHYIYYILDWSKPGSAVVTVLGIIFMIVVTMVVMFGVYKLRRLIYENFHNTKIDLPH